MKKNDMTQQRSCVAARKRRQSLGPGGAHMGLRLRKADFFTRSRELSAQLLTTENTGVAGVSVVLTQK